MQADELKAWADACMSAAQQCPREEAWTLLDMASAFLYAALEADVETEAYSDAIGIARNGVDRAGLSRRRHSEPHRGRVFV